MFRQHPASGISRAWIYRILAQHAVEVELAPLTRSRALYVTHKALLDKNLMAASNGRNT